MWVRKIEQELLEKNPGGFESWLIATGFLAGFLFILVSIWMKFGLGSRSNPMGNTPLSWEELVLQMPRLIIGSFFAAGIIMVLGLLGKNKKTAICEGCFTVTEGEIDGQICSCGGRYIDAEKMTWVDDE